MVLKTSSVPSPGSLPITLLKVTLTYPTVTTTRNLRLKRILVRNRRRDNRSRDVRTTRAQLTRIPNTAGIISLHQPLRNHITDGRSILTCRPNICTRSTNGRKIGVSVHNSKVGHTPNTRTSKLCTVLSNLPLANPNNAPCRLLRPL